MDFITSPGQTHQELCISESKKGKEHSRDWRARLKNSISMSKCQRQGMSISAPDPSLSAGVALKLSSARMPWERRVLPLVLLRRMVAASVCCQSNLSPPGEPIYKALRRQKV